MDFVTKPITPTNPKDIDFDSIGFAFVPTAKMFVSRYSGGAWSDLGIQPLGEFSIHPSASALHYGQSLFEGMKARLTPEGEIVLFRPSDNARRMADGCRRLMMAVYDPKAFVDAVTQTVLANKDYIPPWDKGSLYIRPFMFASGPVLGVRPAEEYTFMVFTSPVGPYFKGGFNPIKLLVSKEFHRATPGGVGCVKAAGNYTGGMHPSHEAKKLGYAEVLYIDSSHHHYEEVGAANFFIRKGDEVATPSLEDKSILPGITRRSVLQLAADAGLKAVERDVLVDEIRTADEAWCTGTAAVITPIGGVNIDGEDITVGDGKVGKWTQIFYDRLNGIMLRKEPDKYGWVVGIGRK
jgi:branched-chain amino acid aminotransferase